MSRAGGSEQAAFVANRPEVRSPQVGDHTTAWGSLQEAELEQVRLVDVLDRVGLLAERDGDRGEADRASAELEGDRLEELAVDPLEPSLVDLVELERLPRDVRGDRALVPYLRDVPDAPEDPVGDARRAA